MEFFNTLNYSSCNEDGLTELRALNIQPGDHVCCITGSGDRVLHMLLGEPEHVYAFDGNPVQNYLLELKMAAIKELDYEGFIKFLGLFPSHERRMSVYTTLRPHLSPYAAKWFDSHQKTLESGILYEGRWERYFKFSATNLRLLRGNKIKRLFQFNDLGQQREFLHSEWNTWKWKLLLLVSFNELAFRYLLGDPGFYKYVRTSFSPGQYIYEQMTHFLENHIARTSFMLALVFHGRFFDSVHFPLYLLKKD